MSTPAQVASASVPQITVWRQLMWAVRREVWEMRSLYLAPLGVSILAVVSFVVSVFHSPGILRPLSAGVPYMTASLLIMAATFILALYYCVEALYGERRDRSILFWKSLPVSDATIVLSKFAVPMVVLPVITFVATVGTHLAMLLVHAITVLAYDGDLSMLGGLGLPSFWLRLLHHFFVLHGLWFAPFYGWLLLVSAWSKRAPLVWALLPPIAVGGLEYIAFGTTFFRDLIRNRVFGPPGGDSFMTVSKNDPVGHVNHAAFLTEPGLWTGLLFTALCLFLATRLRRYRGPNV